MFDYSKKQLMIYLSILIVFILTILVFVFLYRSRSADIRTVAQVQVLADAMENYYDRFNTYPVVAEVEVSQIKILTDEGFNSSGKIIYYQANKSWPRSVSLLSSGSNYIFKFKLKNNWDIWQLPSWWGGVCTMSNNMVLACQSN